jgi:hypothetical protein
MQRPALVLLAMHSLLAVASDPDDWSIDDYKSDSVLALHYGADDNEGSLSGVDLGLPFLSGGRMDAYYSRADARLEDTDTEVDQYGLTWFSDTQQALSAGFGYEFTGRKNIIEIEDKLIIGQYSENNWFLRLKYISGQVKAYTTGTENERPIPNRILERLGDSVAIERKGLGLATGVSGSSWNWRTGLTFYDYDRDLSRMRERLVQYYFKNGVIDQVFQLSNWDFYIDLMFLSDTYSILLGTKVYELHVENETNEQVYTSLELPLSDRFGIGTLISYAVDDSSLYSEVSLNVYW